MTDTFIGPHRHFIVQLPFCGFYESHISQAIDHEDEQAAENDVERQSEEGIPAELRLTQEDFASIRFDTTTYISAYHGMAGDYIDAFNEAVLEGLAIDLGLRFESIDSPREYNFGTDRLFAFVPEPVMRALMVRSAAEGHRTLAKFVAARFTSRSGFSSFYSNDVDDLLANPIDQMDHNQLGVILEAALAIGFKDPAHFENAALTAIMDGEGAYQHLESAVDWEAYEEAVAEKRDEMRAALEPDYIEPAPRCRATPDMFQGAYAHV